MFSMKNWLQYNYHTRKIQSYCNNKHIHQTPLWQANLIQIKIEQCIHNIITTDPTLPKRGHKYKIDQVWINEKGFLPKKSETARVRRPPPSYTVEHPISAINTQPMDKRKMIYVYTDGSTDHNPGKSSFAWLLIPSQPIRTSCGYLDNQRSQQIKYPCSIDVAEATAVQSVLTYLNNHRLNIPTVYRQSTNKY